MKHWWQEAVFYELYVDKFAGNFRELASRLDYLERLGVTALHILPHYPSPMIDDGYDISDYRNVRAELGTLDDLKEFMAEANKRGIRVLLDLVLNHVSSEHPWFQEARSSKENSKRDYFIWSNTGEELRQAANAFPHLKPSNWIYDAEANAYYFATFYPEQPDLNWDNPKIFEEMTSIMDFWIGLGVSGFRLDAAAHLIKRNGTISKGLPETHDVLKKLRAYLDRNAPETALLAEVTDETQARSYFGAGDECHIVYAFSMAERIVFAALEEDEGIVDYEKELMKGIPPDCAWAVFTRNHDELTFHALSRDERKELFAYADPDHVLAFKGVEHGMSVRLATFFKKDPKKLRGAYRILFSLPHTPIIYYGEEIGMENDMTVAQKDTRRYVRAPFDWDLAGKEMNDPNSLFNYIAGLIEKRKEGTVIPAPLSERVLS